TYRSESLGQVHQPPLLHADDVERHRQAGVLGMCLEPGGRRAPDPPLLLAVDHLGRRAEQRPCFLLHLAEDEPPAAPHDQIELVPARPRVRLENAIPAQAVPPARATFGSTAGKLGHAATVRFEGARDCDGSAPSWPAPYGFSTALKILNVCRSTTASARPFGPRTTRCPSRSVRSRKSKIRCGELCHGRLMQTASRPRAFSAWMKGRALPP